MPMGMMQQGGFANTQSPSMMHQNQQMQNYGNMPDSGNVNPNMNMGMSGPGMMNPGMGNPQPGNQYPQHPGNVNNPNSMSSGMYGQGNTPIQNVQQSQMMQQQLGSNAPSATGASNPTPMDTSGSNPPSQPSQQAKELNAASLCRYGAETVQEIVTRAQDVFSSLRQAVPPDGKASTAALDRKPKFQETLKSLRALFKRLRFKYEKMEESFPTSSDTYFEDSLPFKDGPEVTILDDKKNTEAYQQAHDEYREVMEQLLIRNRHLRDTVDHLRQIIWDVNTMLAMRKE